jgi:hypothetical protein
MINVFLKGYSCHFPDIETRYCELYGLFVGVALPKFSSAPAAGTVVCRCGAPIFSSAPAGPAICRCDFLNSLQPQVRADVLASVASTNSRPRRAVENIGSVASTNSRPRCWGRRELGRRIYKQQAPAGAEENLGSTIPTNKTHNLQNFLSISGKWRL